MLARKGENGKQEKPRLQSRGFPTKLMGAPMYHLALPDFSLAKIADSGQCFRMTPLGGGRFSLLAEDRHLLAVQAPGGEHSFACSEEEWRRYWWPYFDLDADYAAWRAAIPEKDAFLTRAAAYGKGIRILRQAPFEMLITFILSQRRSIPAIRHSVEKLCACYGRPLGQGPGGPLYAFPSPEALAGQSCDALGACSLGYRAPYVQAAARMVAEHQLDLEALQAAPYPALMQALHQVPGVGVKVASCVALFGFHRIEAFPVDVWIERVLASQYKGKFPLRRYSGFAGVMQQYMFYYARSSECRPGGALPVC